MIKIDSLTIKFKDKTALDDISLEIPDRIIIGLVGNNGAGKTTLINALLGYYKPTLGNVRLFEKDPFCDQFVAENTILIDEKIAYDPFMSLKSIVDNFDKYSPSFSKEECIKLMKTFGLPEKRLYKRLSKGMKNQFNICIGMAANRDITIYDEPVSGLDERARDLYYKLLLEDFSQNPKLVIVSTHLLSELQNATNKLIVMRDGKVVCFDDTDAIASRFAQIAGSTDKLNPLLASRKVYSQEGIMSLISCVVDNNFSRNELKYIKEQAIDFDIPKPNTACKIICNSDWVDKKTNDQNSENLKDELSLLKVNEKIKEENKYDN